MGLKAIAALAMRWPRQGWARHPPAAQMTEHRAAAGPGFGHEGRGRSPRSSGCLRRAADRRAALEVAGPRRAWNGVRKADALPSSCQQGRHAQRLRPCDRRICGDQRGERGLPLPQRGLRRSEPRETLPALGVDHGGGFTGGSASVPIYDGSKLAAQGVVVIAINYRLGALRLHGASRADRREPDAVPRATTGLLDQIAALAVDQDNAAAFGGDPRG